MDVWFSIEKAPLPRGTNASRGALKGFAYVLLPGPQERLCLLDMYLASKLGYRASGIHFSGYRVRS